MTQIDFYEGIIKLIAIQAKNKDPDKMAFSIYFYMKQHPENVKQDKAWGEMLFNMKKILTERLAWTMREVHPFFAQLSELTKYMEKST